MGSQQDFLRVIPVKVAASRNSQKHCTFEE